jgi:hypothetical protein
MTNLFLIAEQNHNSIGVILLICWTLFGVWFIGHTDWITYYFPYAEKKKRRVKSYNSFYENFETLKKREGLTVDEFKKAERELYERAQLVKRTKYAPPTMRRFSPGDDIFERDGQGNKIPDLSHITHFDQNNNPVYGGKIRIPPRLRANNKPRILLISIMLIIWFGWLVINT